MGLCFLGVLLLVVVFLGGVGAGVEVGMKVETVCSPLVAVSLARWTLSLMLGGRK